eukprot:3222168-Prymnesium_polylepis.3
MHTPHKQASAAPVYSRLAASARSSAATSEQRAQRDETRLERSQLPPDASRMDAHRVSAGDSSQRSSAQHRRQTGQRGDGFQWPRVQNMSR